VLFNAFVDGLMEVSLRVLSPSGLHPAKSLAVLGVLCGVPSFPPSVLAERSGRAAEGLPSGATRKLASYRAGEFALKSARVEGVIGKRDEFSFLGIPASLLHPLGDWVDQGLVCEMRWMRRVV